MKAGFQARPVTCQLCIPGMQSLGLFLVWLVFPDLVDLFTGLEEAYRLGQQFAVAEPPWRVF